MEKSYYSMIITQKKNKLLLDTIKSVETLKKFQK